MSSLFASKQTTTCYIGTAFIFVLIKEKHNVGFDMTEEASLKDVVDRLDQLISLWKLANLETIRKIKDEIMKDPIFRRILQLADGSRDRKTLAEKVAKSMGKTSRTVSSRITELVEKGALQGIRRGNKTFYKRTGLYD